MSEQSDQQNRQPPRFVPTLTDMVRTTLAGPAPGPGPEPAQPSPPNLGADMPAVFAELLKDWPALGEPLAAHAAPQNGTPSPGRLTDRPVEQMALRVEALVMQRLPVVLGGLVAQAVRDALREQEDALKAERPKS